MRTWPFVFLFLFYACSGAFKGEDTEEKEHAHGEIRITEELILEQGLELAIVDSGYIYYTYKFPAHVVESKEASAIIRVRFPGIITKIYRGQGDRVKEGEVVAQVESDESFSTYSITSPISGIVVEQMVSEGEAVDKGQPIMKVMNLKEVWVKGMIYPQKAPMVREGQTVEVHRHFGDRYVKLEGRIFLVSPQVDEETRLLPVFIEVENDGGILKPGMYGDVVLRDSQRVHRRLPMEAVHVMGSDTVVFLKRGERVEQRIVSLGIRGENYVEVLDGVSVGDTVFAKNSFVIKAEMEKESWMEEGHSH